MSKHLIEEQLEEDIKSLVISGHVHELTTADDHYVRWTGPLDDMMVWRVKDALKISRENRKFAKNT